MGRGVNLFSNSARTGLNRFGEYILIVRVFDKS